MPEIDWHTRAGTRFRCEKQPATGTRGMVVTNHPLASAAGAEMLAAGGNAIDAAIAAFFALSVVEPMMVGVLGGGMAHIRLADGRHVVIDGQSTAPLATGPTTFTPDPNAAPGTMDAIGRKNALGPTAVAAPGNLKGWCEALSRFGTFPLADVMEPAIRHASRGFRVTPYLHECVTDSAADMARERGQHCFELIILHDLLRMGEAGAALRARDVSELVDGSQGEAIGLHAQAVVSRRGSDIELAAAAFTRMDHALTASQLWAMASVSYRCEGLHARSTKAAKKSSEMAALCEGAKIRTATPADQVEPLSRRQREVALLAAQGATNAEIADALSLSVRTVESHLYAAFAKLGLTAREELNAVLVRPRA